MAEETQTKEELMERARELDVEGRSSMDKATLEKAVRKAEKKSDSESDSEPKSSSTKSDSKDQDGEPKSSGDLEEQAKRAEEDGNPATEDGENLNVTENDGTQASPGVVSGEDTEERRTALEGGDDGDLPLTPGDRMQPEVSAVEESHPEDSNPVAPKSERKGAGRAIVYRDGSGNEYETELEEELEDGRARFMVNHRLITAEEGDGPGEWSSAE